MWWWSCRDGATPPYKKSHASTHSRSPPPPFSDYTPYLGVALPVRGRELQRHELRQVHLILFLLFFVHDVFVNGDECV